MRSDSVVLSCRIGYETGHILGKSAVAVSSGHYWQVRVFVLDACTKRRDRYRWGDMAVVFRTINAGGKAALSVPTLRIDGSISLATHCRPSSLKSCRTVVSGG
jgi:hypothetical protein